ncbi:MAG: hypothetical protein IT292_11265 [Deltaproteobacteria bacterium]|nr:hypothetical protein [Deltaproteobacteria bacterium]
MFSNSKSRMIFADIETVPCAWGIKRAMKLEKRGDESAVEEMYAELRKKEHGGGNEVTQPFPKHCFHRVVTISCLIREKQEQKDPEFSLVSFPSVKTCQKCDKREDSESEKDAIVAEREVLSSFLRLYETNFGNTQTFTYNGSGFDLSVILQRAVIVGVPLGKFGKRPTQGWNEPSIYHRDNPWFVDLMKVLSLGNTGKAVPSLNEMLTQMGFPGKMETSGSGVYDLWKERRFKAIRDYNDYDAISTYLLFAAMGYAGGLFTLEQFKEEELKTLQTYLEEKRAEEEYAHLQSFLKEWKQVQRV